MQQMDELRKILYRAVAVDLIRSMEAELLSKISTGLEKVDELLAVKQQEQNTSTTTNVTNSITRDDVQHIMNDVAINHIKNAFIEFNDYHTKNWNSQIECLLHKITSVEEKIQDMDTTYKARIADMDSRYMDALLMKTVKNEYCVKEEHVICDDSYDDVMIMTPVVVNTVAVPISKDESNKEHTMHINNESKNGNEVQVSEGGNEDNYTTDDENHSVNGEENENENEIQIEECTDTINNDNENDDIIDSNNTDEHDDKQEDENVGEESEEAEEAEEVDEVEEVEEEVEETEFEEITYKGKCYYKDQDGLIYIADENGEVSDPIGKWSQKTNGVVFFKK
jgi:hypothetical protein